MVQNRNHSRRTILVCLGTVLFVWSTPWREPIRTSGQQTSRPLPNCSAQYDGPVIPSPFFDSDQTLFWLFSDYRRAGVLRSSDNGRSWLQVLDYTYSLGDASVRQFQVAPISPDSGLTTYAEIDYRVYRYSSTSWQDTFILLQSSNGGDTWSQRFAPCTAWDCRWFSLRATNRTGTLFQPRMWFFGYPGLPEGVARSEDGGGTWQQVWSETPVEAVAVSPSFDQDETLFAALAIPSVTLSTGFVISNDAGETWHGGGQGLCPNIWTPQLEVSPDFAHDQTLLMSLYQSSLFISQDGGLTWRAIFPPGSTYCGNNTNFGAIYPQFSPDYSSDSTIYAATPQGLYASYDAGQSWFTLVSDASTFNLSVRRAPATGKPAARGRVDHVSPKASSTSLSFLPLIAVWGSGLPFKPHTMFMEAQPAGVGYSSQYRSDDGGATWQCMEIPTVRRRSFLPLLGIGS